MIHWTENADRVFDDGSLLGEDEFGELWVPSKTRSEWWDRRFSWWRPTHWPYWLRSRRRRALAFIETAPSASGATTG